MELHFQSETFITGKMNNLPCSPVYSTLANTVGWYNIPCCGKTGFQEFTGVGGG